MPTNLEPKETLAKTIIECLDYDSEKLKIITTKKVEEFDKETPLEKKLNHIRTNNIFDLTIKQWQVKDLGNKGHAKAINNLGKMYEEGKIGVKEEIQSGGQVLKVRNYSKAREYFEKGAERNDKDSLYGLSNIYRQGLDVLINPQKASMLRIRAAEEGHIEATYYLGTMPPKEQEEIYQEAIGYLTRGGRQEFSIQRGFELVSRSAEQGHVLSIYTLGKIYYAEDGGRVDYVKSRFWFSSAAELGSIQAQRMLGNIYFGGQGVRQDLKKGFDWYLGAANKGDIIASCIVAQLYRRGLGVDKNVERSVPWYKKCVYADNISTKDEQIAVAKSACRLASMHYYRRGGLDGGFDKAIELFKIAASYGWEKAYTDLGSMYYKGDPKKTNYPESIFWLMKAYHGKTKRWHNRALHILSDMFNRFPLESLSGSDQLTRLRISGHRLAELNKRWQSDSEEIIRYDFRAVVFWYFSVHSAAAIKGINNIDFELKGEELKSYLRVFENDAYFRYVNGKEDLLPYFELVKTFFYGIYEVAKTDKYAQRTLGYLYETGEGRMAKNHTAAIEWYEKSAKQGLKQAQYSLGTMLQGEGKLDKAKTWFKKAAAQEYEPAIAILKELNKPKENDN